MKHIFGNLMVACLMFVASTGVAMAQTQANVQNQRVQRQRPNMEQFAKAQAERIAKTLAFDDNTSKKFIETYCASRKEMAATHTERPDKKRSEMTDADVDKAIRARFQQGHKMLDIREKYYKAYLKFLSPKQIQRVYELEKQDMKHFEKRGQQKRGPQNRGQQRGQNRGPKAQD